MKSSKLIFWCATLVTLSVGMAVLAQEPASKKTETKKDGAKNSDVKKDSDARPAEKVKAGADGKAPRLLWVRSKYGGASKEKLVESEKLTVAEYKKRGVDVVELKQSDLDAWREGEGKDLAKAGKYIQYINYARKLNVQAVGGLAVFEITSDMEEDFDKKAGDYFYGWGISLTACDSNFRFNLEGGDDVRAIPMNLSEDDSWAIPAGIVAKSCDSVGLVEDYATSENKGRPFLGVMLDGKKINTVVKDSPADLAGIKAGDELVSVGGKEISSISELAEFMRDKKPGDEVAVEFQRESKREKKTIKLADRGELETKNAPDGKPLPALAGKDITGRDVRMADFKGKVVLMDFWATWCGPCVEEMPLMQLTWENLKDKGLVWVGVSGDQDEDAWRDFVKDNHLGGIQLRSEDWGNAMAVGSFPTIFLVDRGGVVGCRVRGGTIAQAAAAMLQN